MDTSEFYQLVLDSKNEEFTYECSDTRKSALEFINILHNNQMDYTTDFYGKALTSVTFFQPYQNVKKLVEFTTP